MFRHRNRFMRRKVRGGSILGNLFNKSKGILYASAKKALPQAKRLLKNAGKKAITAGVDTLKKEVTPEKAFDLGKSLALGTPKQKSQAKQQVKAILKKSAISAKNAGLADARQRNAIIDEFAGSKDVKALLKKKAVALARQELERGRIGNIIAGSGSRLNAKSNQIAYGSGMQML